MIITDRFLGQDCGGNEYIVFYLPPVNEVDGGIQFHFGHPFVRLSVCSPNRVRSVSSTILAGSISYLRILLANFRRCVA